MQARWNELGVCVFVRQIRSCTMQVRTRTLQIKSRTMSGMTGCSVSTVQGQVLAMLLGPTAESDAACMKV